MRDFFEYRNLDFCDFIAGKLLQKSGLFFFDTIHQKNVRRYVLNLIISKLEKINLFDFENIIWDVLDFIWIEVQRLSQLQLF